MYITAEQPSSHVTIVHLSGRLDLQSAPEMKQYLIDLVGQDSHLVVVDLEDTIFVDSSGLSALISGLKAARQKGGDLRIARPSKQVEVILNLTTLNHILKPYTSLEDALEHYE
jgi:anti-anti-sigma factor